MNKKKEQAGVIPLPTANCGQQGCSIPYIMPFAGTRESFERHSIEKFKPYRRAA